MCVIYHYFHQMKTTLIAAIEIRGHTQGPQSRKYLPRTYSALNGKCVDSCCTVWIFSVHVIILSCAYNTVIITSGGNISKPYSITAELQGTWDEKAENPGLSSLGWWWGVQGALIWDLHPSTVFLGCLLQGTMGSQVLPELALWKNSFVPFSPGGHQNFSSTFWPTLYKSSQSRFSEHGPRAFSITIPGKAVCFLRTPLFEVFSSVA